MEELFKAQNQEEFLSRARKHYEDRWFSDTEYIYTNPLYYKSDIESLEWLYKLGRDYKVLNMDFNQFKRCMTTDYLYGMNIKLDKSMRFKRGYRYWYAHETRFSPENYRVLRKFIYSGQPKKDKELSPRQARHLQKNKRKDRQLTRNSHYWRKPIKHYTNRLHRRREKFALKTDNPDILHSRSHKNIKDVWAFD